MYIILETVKKINITNGNSYKYTRGVHNVSFPLVPQLLNHLLLEATHVHDRVMPSHDACTSGISRVLTVASLQRLKVEALIPAPANCEVRSVILNAQNIQYFRSKFIANCARTMATHGLAVNIYPAGVRLGVSIINQPKLRTSRPVISIFSYTSRNSYPASLRMTERRR